MEAARDGSARLHTLGSPACNHREATPYGACKIIGVGVARFF
jgi:hypothetical protein